MPEATLQSRRDRAAATVLVIDDEVDIREMIEFTLSRDGYRVLTADGGEHAIAIAKKHPLDLIITDIKMPGMNGLETLERLQQLAPDTAAIVVTGYITPDTIAGCTRVGVREFIRKPFLIRDLEDAVARQLAGR